VIHPSISSCFIFPFRFHSTGTTGGCRGHWGLGRRAAGGRTYVDALGRVSSFIDRLRGCGSGSPTTRASSGPAPTSCSTTPAASASPCARRSSHGCAPDAPRCRTCAPEAPPWDPRCCQETRWLLRAPLLQIPAAAIRLSCHETHE
jgi:hypothetical protein